MTEAISRSGPEAAWEQFKDVVRAGEDVESFDSGYRDAEEFLKSMPPEQRSATDSLDLVMQCVRDHLPGDVYGVRQAATVYGIIAAIRAEQGVQQ